MTPHTHRVHATSFTLTSTNPDVTETLGTCAEGDGCREVRLGLIAKQLLESLTMEHDPRYGPEGQFGPSRLVPEGCPVCDIIKEARAALGDRAVPSGGGREDVTDRTAICLAGMLCCGPATIALAWTPYYWTLGWATAFGFLGFLFGILTRDV